MTRPPTACEKKYLRYYYPKLDLDNVVISADADPAYNCLAWTVGHTDCWLWPNGILSLSDFDRLYERYGYTRAGSGPIAAWGLNERTMMHGSVSGPGHGPRWESKAGPFVRFQHDRDELAGGSAGKIIAYYRPRNASVAPAHPPPPAVPTHHVKAIAEAAAQLPRGLRDRFEEAFDAWKATWSRPDAGISSDPSSTRHSAEFGRLVELGAQTLPAVVGKLVDPSNFFALQLYDTLLVKPHAAPAVEGIQVVMCEQDRALRTVERFAADLASGHG